MKKETTNSLDQLFNIGLGMPYIALAPIFFISIFIFLFAIFCITRKPLLYLRYKLKLQIFTVTWFASYAFFILFFTGPRNLQIYPPPEGSPYKLPWRAEVQRFVAQGNRSFTSHRGFHEYAWDFVMPNGAEVLAARRGRVFKITDNFEGIGLYSNSIEIQHDDGQFSIYAHISQNGAMVKIGDFVEQGQPIALSGMVGQTIFPHVHFLIINKERSMSLPTSFADVPGGVPFAGRFYKSDNK